MFFQGCLLRCIYCHNPDTWQPDGGNRKSVAEVVAQIEKYSAFRGKDGGVTLSGGEPLLQNEFCELLLTELKHRGIHTAIDTSGAVPLEKSARSLETADLILLDIKSLDTGTCRKLTGFGNENTLRTLEYLEETGKPVWLRHVLMPGYTLVETELRKLARYLNGFTNIEKIELLPFHKMGEYKWRQLGIPYNLENIPEPDGGDVEMAEEIFASFGLPI